MTTDEHKARLQATVRMYRAMGYEPLPLLINELARLSACVEQIRTGSWASEEYDPLFKPGET